VLSSTAGGGERKKKLHSQTRTSPAQGRKDDDRTGAPVIQRTAERVGTVQPTEEAAQEDLIHVYKYRIEVSKDDRARHCSTR